MISNFLTNMLKRFSAPFDAIIQTAQLAYESLRFNPSRYYALY